MGSTIEEAREAMREAAVLIRAYDDAVSYLSEAFEMPEGLNRERRLERALCRLMALRDRRELATAGRG